ncbi:MAG: toxic anion resistance protein [Succinivibrio sp.]|jgi:uncharacterized protein YaaN involved in tellurite resistance|nr:toxic anion resistance protein [Succinivibrio sp.]
MAESKDTAQEKTAEVQVPPELENVPERADLKAQALSEISFDDPSLSLSYGAKAMGGIAAFADTVLSKVRVKDAGEAGADLSSLLSQVRSVDVTAVGEKKGFLASLPFLGGLFDKGAQALAKFDTVSEQVGKIAAKLEDAQLSLLKDIEVLEQLFARNSELYGTLTAYISAGEQKLKEAREVTLPKMEQKVNESKDSFEAQKLRDFADTLNRFERRLHDLRLSRTITLQSAPQIRMIQNNDRTLAEKIQTSILATIPIWKNQLVLALSAGSQRQAAKLQQDVADTTNAMLKKNAQMLHDATVATATQVERSVVDIETLKQSQASLISTIEETLKIAQDGHERRMQAQSELESMEGDLRTRLSSLAVKAREQAIAQAHTAGASATAQKQE